MKKIIPALLLASASLLPAFAQASILPSGVQNDVTAATVASWGFTECHAETYGYNNTSIAGALAGCSGDYLMMGARRTGSSVFEVLAAANTADVIFDTGTGDTTHSANNVEWYFNSNYSWGFAGAGDLVTRNSCDTSGSSWMSQPPERDRLCWHTSSGIIDGGWRAGSFIELNGNTDWERVLLVGSARAEVPEPASLGLLGLGLLGLAVARRRLNKQK